MTKKAPQHFNSSSKTAALINDTDWSNSSLGPIETWPLSLKTAVRILLECKLPMYMAWGKDFIQFYNDAYIPILGLKHPEAMSSSAPDTWPEIWPTIGPMWEEVWQGNSIGFDNFKLTIERFHYQEDCYFNFSYSPVPDDDGNVAGVLVTFVETTEMVRGQEKLKDERDNLYSVFEQAPMPIAIVRGDDLVYELSNTANQKFYGGQNLVGIKVADTPGATEENHKLLKSVYDTGERFIGRAFPAELNSDGKPRLHYLDLLFEPFRDQTGKVDGIIMTGVDVTDSVVAKLKAEQSEKYLKEFLDSLPLIIWSCNSEGQVNYFNRCWWNYSGLDPVKDFHQLAGVDIIHPDERDFVMESFGQSFKKGIPFEAKYRLLSASDQYRWHLVRLTPLHNVNGEVVSWIGTATDVNDLLEAQSRFTAFFEQSSLPMEIYDLNGTPIQVNKAWEELFATTFDQLQGYNVLQDPQIEKNGIKSLILKAMEGEAVEATPFYYNPSEIGKTGRERWLEASFFPVMDANEGVREIAMILRDVTDRELAQANLIKSNAELEMAVRARQDLLNICGHELKTPLSSLRLQTQTAKRRIAKGDDSVYAPEKVDKLLDLYGNQIERLVHLVDDMLDFTRISSGKLNLTPEKVNLSELVIEVVDHFAEQLAAADCTVTTSLDSDVIGFWDRYRIEQVMANLLTNAIKYGRGFPVKLEVTKSKDQKFAILKVRDHGMGIAAENHDKIFNRFERVVSANEVSGLGLGLYITKDIILNHNGSIRVESALNEGSEFIVELPLRGADET